MRFPSVVVALLSSLACTIAGAACGGAVDNGDLNQKQNGSSSGSSGATPTPTAVPLPTSGPTSPPPPVPQPKPQGKCDVRFQKDVVEGVFVQNNCTNKACHGGPNARAEPTLDIANPAAIYKTLITFTLSNAQRYVIQNGNPTSSGLHCNLRGSCGVAMPIDMRPSQTDLDVIDTWLACGAPFN